jgi:hypothetical protein
MKTPKPKKPQFEHPVSTPEGRRERAVAVLRDPHGFVHEKWEFLRQKGMSDNEILGALNDATDGEVIRAAGIDWPAGTVTIEPSRQASS